MLKVTAVLLALVSGMSAAAEKPRLAFVGLKPLEGVTEPQAAALTELAQNELQKLGIYNVISSRDIAELLVNERQKQLMGCSDESNSCMEELAGALNAQRTLVGQVSLVGETAFFTFTLLNTQKSVVVARVTRKSDGAKTIEPLFELMQSAIYELVNEDPLHGATALKPEKGFGGLAVGVRADADVLGLRVAPSVTVEYSRKWVGVAATLIIKGSPGVRLEARVFPFTVGRFRPYVAVGGTAFPSGVALRGAVGGAVRVGNFHLFLDAGYERFLYAADGYLFDAALVGGGVAWSF